LAQEQEHPYRVNAWTDKQMGDTHSAEYNAETSTQLIKDRTDNYQHRVEQNWNNFPMGDFERTRTFA
jgi:hypothetical protein